MRLTIGLRRCFGSPPTWHTGLLSALILLMLSAGSVRPGDNPGAAAIYRKVKATYQAVPQQSEAAWQFARACFDLADIATNKTQRAEIAEEAIAACRNALVTNTNSAPLHYYLALNMGQLAQTRGLSALKLVNQMEHELLTAVALDAKFDYAGPERTLGMLYRDAPAIASIGNRTKAREHLRRAVELSPLFPENRLEFVQSLIKWNDRTGARQELQTLQQEWSAAQAALADEKWAPDWKRWEEQLSLLKKKLGEPAKLDAPRHQ